MHNLNVNQDRNTRDSEKPKSVPGTQQRGSFYSSAAETQSFLRDLQKVVWHGHLNHVCSAQCIVGLSTELSSADDAVSQRQWRNMDAPAAMLPSKTISVDSGKESRKYRSSSEVNAHQKPTARKSTAQRLRVAFSFMDKKKRLSPYKISSALKSVDTPTKTASVDCKASLSEETITVIDSDSDTEDSEKRMQKQPTVCRCSKGFRSVRGHGHYHCRHCAQSFHNRLLLYRHKEEVHGETKPISVDKTSSDTVNKKLPQLQQLSRNKSKKFTDLSSKGQNADKCNKNEQAGRVESGATETDVIETFSPYRHVSNTKAKQSQPAPVVKSPSVTQLSSSNRKRTLSGSAKLIMLSTDEQKDSLSVKSANSDGCLNVQTTKSTRVAGIQRTEAYSVRCSGSCNNSSVRSSISQQKLNECTVSSAIKVPLLATTTQQLTGSCSSSITFSVNDAFSAVSLSATSQSIPVIGVAKAVPVVSTAVEPTTSTSNQSIYSLHRFSTETLWSELCRRGGMRSCECGVSFMDSALYLLHRSCHSHLAQLQCAFCDYKAATSYDFHAHLLDHKK